MTVQNEDLEYVVVSEEVEDQDVLIANLVDIGPLIVQNLEILAMIQANLDGFEILFCL